MAILKCTSVPNMYIFFSTRYFVWHESGTAPQQVFAFDWAICLAILKWKKHPNMYVFSMFFQIGNLFCNKLEQTFQHVFNVFVFLIAIHLAVRNNMSKLSQHGGVRGTDDFHHFINFHRKRSAKICISGVYLYPLSAFFYNHLPMS